MKQGPNAGALAQATRQAQATENLEYQYALTDVRLEHRIDGQLWAVRGDDERAVWVRRCFPWSKPAQYVSLRDNDENEVALIRDFGDLDSESRDALARALAEAGFVLRVARIIEIDEEVEIRNWKVETRHGSRTFQTRLDDWPREVPGGGVLIRDVAGDLYLVSDPEGLDKKSRDLLWAFVD
jgi:hypothetical protein